MAKNTLYYSSLDARITIAESGEMGQLRPETSTRVAALWTAERRERGSAVFNGEIFSVDQTSPSEITGKFIEFARFSAQRRDPALFGELAVRPLAVTGLLRSPDGIVFGRRLRGSMQDPGMWELVPSGFVDPDARRADGTLAPEIQVLRELREEVGLRPDLICQATPFCLIDDPETRIVDIGVALETTATGPEIQAAYAALGDEQYTDLMVIPRPSLADFLTRDSHRIAAVSRLMLRRESECSLGRPARRVWGATRECCVR